MPTLLAAAKDPTDVLDDLKPAGPKATVLDPAKAHLGKTIKNERQLIRARFSPDGLHLAAAGLDKIIHVWELETEKKHTLPGHVTWVSALVFNPKGKQLFTADFQGNIRAWDYVKPDSQPLFTITGADRQITRALAVTTDGALLLSGGDDGVVRAWSTKDGKPAKEFGTALTTPVWQRVFKAGEPGHCGGIYALAVHPDGKSFVSGDQFGVAKHWEIASGKLVRDLDARLLYTRKEDFIADVGGVRCFAFDAKGERLAAGGLSKAESNAFCPGTPAVLVFDWTTGKALTELKLTVKSDGPINGLRYLSDGTLAGFGEHQSAATVCAFWKPADKPEPFHTVSAQSATDLDLHPDGQRLVAPLFVANGSGGNGAREKFKDKYVQNASQIALINLFAKVDTKPAKPVKKA